MDWHVAVAQEAQQAVNITLWNHDVTLAAATGLALAERKRRKDEEARQRAEAQREAADAAFVQQMLTAQQAESHRSQDRKIERMETKTSLARLETHLKAPFRRPADKRPPSDAVIIPPLTAEQYAVVKNWNTAAQVAAYAITAAIWAGIGAALGSRLGVPGAFIGSVVGALVGTGWGAYEAICISSAQDEFDEAYQQGSGVTVWRDGWKFNVDATSRDGMYTQANAPLSALYVAVTTLLLTGKIP